MKKRIVQIVIILVIQNITHAQTRYLFFDYKIDSIKSRQAAAAMPLNGQTASISNSLIVDYVGNTRIGFNTSIITSKKDTFLAMHSLFNGVGNLLLDVETPIYLWPIRNNKKDFFGFSFNPRASSILSQGNIVEKTSLSGDIGFNSVLKISGDLGTISCKIIWRNALGLGNYQFLKKLYNVNGPLFFYSTLQFRIKAGNGIFLINVPLYLQSIAIKIDNNLPVYAGVGINF